MAEARTDLLVVGLGNPGAEFDHTRHNAGADTVALLASRHNERLRSGREHALVATARVGDLRMVLAYPQTYMNDSGRSVAALVRRFGVSEPGRVVIVHDEIDLPVGRLQVKEGGGLAGHNGLRSIRDHLHTADFLRIRIGVGRPPGRKQGADYVLRRPSKAETQELAVMVELAADAVEMILTEGVAAAMNKFNQRPTE